MASEHSNRGAKRAREARADLGFTREGPLPDVLAAVEHGGVHAVVLELPEGVAGAYVNRPDCPLLFVNGAQARRRQRFTLAHEFGHHRMGHASVVDEQARDQRLRPRSQRGLRQRLRGRVPHAARCDRGRGDASTSIGAVTLEHVVLLAARLRRERAGRALCAETSAKVLTDTRRGEQLDAEITQELHVALGERLGLVAARRRACRCRTAPTADPDCLAQ